MVVMGMVDHSDRSHVGGRLDGRLRGVSTRSPPPLCQHGYTCQPLWEAATNPLVHRGVD